MKPSLIILRGPCGGGKTTIARELASRLNGEHIEVDAIKNELSGSTDASDWPEVESWFYETNRRILECIQHNAVAIVDEAFAEPALFKIVVDGLEDKADIIVVEIMYLPEEHIRRYAQKPRKIHPTEEALRTYYEQYKTGILPKNDASDFQIINNLSFTDPNESVDLIVENIVAYLNKARVTNAV